MPAVKPEYLRVEQSELSFKIMSFYKLYQQMHFRQNAKCGYDGRYHRQDTHRMKDVKLWRVGEMNLSVEKHEVSHTIRMCPYSSLSYAACKAHAPFYSLTCGLSRCIIIYFRLFHKCQDFRGEKYLLNLNTCFEFLATDLGLHISHPKKNSARYQHYCTEISM